MNFEGPIGEGKDGLNYDFSDFNLGFLNAAENLIPGIAVKAVKAGLDQVIIDANEIEPKTPHLLGHLKGTGQVHSVELTPEMVTGIMSFGNPKGGQGGAPYALRWHEVEPGTVNWSEPGVGPKYLESKLVRFKDKYVEIIFQYILNRWPRTGR